MPITYKLTLLHILALAVVLGLYGWFSVQREASLIEADKQQDEQAYGRCLAELVRQVQLDHGDQRAIDLLDRVGSVSDLLAVRWQWLGTGGAAATPEVVATLRAGRTAVVVDHGAPEGQLTTYVPVSIQPDRIGVVALEETLADEITFVRGSVWRVLLATVASAALLGALAAVAGARLVGKPMKELVLLARRVAQGDLTSRLHRDQRDEIGDLAREMNLMCDRLVSAREDLQRETSARIAAMERLRQNDRLATVGRVAAGMAHELGTPLSVIQGHADLIAGGELDDDQLPESARTIGRLTRRMAGTIRQMLDFARHREAAKDEHDLLAVVRRSLALLEDLARRSSVSFDLQGEPARAEVDAAQIEQVVTNLALNAIHAMPDGGVVQVRVDSAREAMPARDGTAGGGPTVDVARIRIEDHGTGIQPEHLAILFEPFFTTKPLGQGTGLGLPIAQTIVHEHGGWIEVHSEVGAGSTFVVHLPRDGGTA